MSENTGPRKFGSETSNSYSRVDKPSAAPGRFGPFRLLLVDDSQFSQKLAVSLLSKEGHVVEVVSSGRDALTRVLETSYDFILMDIQMPGMDGVETTRRIRQREETSGKRTPIVAMTAHAMLGDREHCLAAGMDEYITKPLRLEKLTGVFAGLIDQLSRHASQATPCEESGKSWDWQASLKTIGDAKLLEAIAVTFQADSHRMVTDLRRAAGQSDAAVIGKAATVLHDTLRLFGETPPLKTVAQIKAAAEQEDFDEIDAALPKFGQQMEAFLSDLSSYVALRKAETPHGSTAAAIKAAPLK